MMQFFTTGAGISGGRFRLSLTDYSSGLLMGHGRVTLTGNSEEERYTYRITVEGTGISEVWNSDERKSTDAIVNDWLDAVEDRWTEEIASVIRQYAKAEPLWHKKSSDSETKAIPLPPVQEEAGTAAENSENK